MAILRQETNMHPDRLNKILKEGFHNDKEAMAKSLGIPIADLEAMLAGLKPIPSWIQERFDSPEEPPPSSMLKTRRFKP